MDANPPKPAQLVPDHNALPTTPSSHTPKSRNNHSSRAEPHSESSTPVSDVRDQPHPAPPTTHRFTSHLQPYPGPAGPYVMNPPYAMNGAPYQSSPSPFPQHPSPTNGQSPHVGPGIPGHAQHYSYPVHHPAYAHGYPSYPHYPPSNVVMYSSPPTSAHPEASRAATAPSPVPAASGSGKRKRKSGHDDEGDGLSNEYGADSGGDLARSASGSGASLVVDTKKRTKTQRACDSCRSRKIRCDVLPDADPPVCQHCKQYGFECTFFLPITETRFKKKKLEEEAAAVAAAEKEKDDRSTSSPQTDNKGGETRILGPTAVAYMVHSQAAIPSRTYESYDMRYHHSWDVSDADGIIRVHEPQQGELQLALPKPIDLRIERDVVEKLVNAYFEEVAPMLPVVTKEEFIANSPPPPILLYAICLVTAARREVPQEVFDSIRHTVNSLIKAEDVLSTASTVNIQALLILCMSGDCHSQFVPNALSALWIRLGCAIRMAQDLGLHRAESVKEKIESRRRLWGACLVSDRWISLTYGHPFMINVQDCDARVPSSDDPDDMYMRELVRLSLILGRVQKAIYTPAGLTTTSDAELHQLLADLEAWRNHLPEELQFRGPETPKTAGLLFLLYSTVNMIFWRVFMRISYTCPSHLKFALTVEKWTGLVQLTSQAIDWLVAHEHMYDQWLLIAYCATSCALVQYHTWARRRDPEAVARLKNLRDCVRRWEASLSPDHMSARRKTAEIIALLYEATQGPQESREQPPPLNPTGGVKPKPPFDGLVFQKDPSRPGGGVYVAFGKDSKRIEGDVPVGTIISGGEDGNQGEAAGAAMLLSGTRNDHAPSSSSLARSGSAASWARASAGVASGSQSQQQHVQQQQQQYGADPPVGYSPMVGQTNVNPALNAASMSAPGHVQVLNVLDVPQASNTLEQFAMADTGFLEGIPGSMFDWGQWDNFFSRVAPQFSAASYQQRVAEAGSPQEAQQPYQYPGGGM